MEENTIQSNDAANEPQSTPNVEPSNDGDSGLTFLSENDVANLSNEISGGDTTTTIEQPTETLTEPVEDQQEQYSSGEVEGAVFGYLSEKLGRDISSLDDLSGGAQEQRELDQRISVIADFVEKTGRDPKDWFVYQSMNPSEMDDLTAVQVQMASEYANLSQEEIKMLISDKYKVDPDLYDEDEIKLSQLQMRIDAEKARSGIEGLRSQYQSPERTKLGGGFSPVNDEWLSSMKKEVAAVEGVEFDLGNGKNFTFGMDDKARSRLMEKNARLDNFFDAYVEEGGNWDHEKLNTHQAVIDNMDDIVKSVYRQGISDGQRGLVDKAANVSAQSPNRGSVPKASDPLTQQLKEALGHTGGGFGFI